VNRSCPVIRSHDRLRRRAPYLVRLIKPNLIASHDWHVQPICQRSLRATRLSETLGSRPEPKSGLSSNLMRNADFVCLYCRLRRFGANLLNLSKPLLQVKQTSRLNHGNNGSHCAKIKERPAKNARAARARREITLWVMQWLVLCGIPYRGSTVQQCITSDPTNQLPTSLTRAGHTATGRLHCSATT